MTTRPLVSRCQTLYSVRAEILPPAGEQHCRSGLVCELEVCITRLTEPSEGEVAEDSKTDTDGLKTTRLMYEGESAAGFFFFLFFFFPQGEHNLVI